MLTVAVTGGVACGKSSFCRRLLERAPEGRVYHLSSDEVVRELVKDPSISLQIQDLGRASGSELAPHGELDRTIFRELLFENSEFRGKVEALLHPLVLDRAVTCLSKHSESVRIFLVEVPLLYEVDFPLHRDLVVVVGASESVQRRRLTEERGLEQELVSRILKSQKPLHEKISPSDIVVWNDGSREAFDAQSDHLLLRWQSFLNT